MCVSFCRLFVSFKLHAVSITRRFQHMPFPVSRYPPSPLLAVSSSHVLHAVSITRAFSVPKPISLYLLLKKQNKCIPAVEKRDHSWTAAIQHFALPDLSSFFPPWLTFPSAFPAPPTSSLFRLPDARCWEVAWLLCTGTTTTSCATWANDVCCAESRWDQFFRKQLQTEQSR